MEREWWNQDPVGPGASASASAGAGRAGEAGVVDIVGRLLVENGSVRGLGLEPPRSRLVVTRESTGLEQWEGGKATLYVQLCVLERR